MFVFSCADCEYFNFEDGKTTCLKLKKKNKIDNVFEILPNCPLNKEERLQ